MLRVLTDDPASNIMEVQILGRTLLGRRTAMGLELYETHTGLSESFLGLGVSDRMISLGVLPGPVPRDTEAFLDQALGRQARQRLWLAWAAGMQVAMEQDMGPARLNLHDGELRWDEMEVSMFMDAPWLPDLVQGIHTVIDGRLRRRDVIPVDPDDAPSWHARMEMRTQLMGLAAHYGIDMQAWLDKVSKR